MIKWIKWFQELKEDLKNNISKLRQYPKLADDKL